MAAFGGYLMDTSIVSAFAPGKPPPPRDMAAWMHSNADLMFVPALALQELRKGIAKLHRSGGHDRAARLLSWLERIPDVYGDRVLDVNPAVAMTAGVMEDAATAAGRNPGLADILIASTAKTYSLRLLTANVRHFVPLDVDCVNPFEVSGNGSPPPSKAVRRKSPDDPGGTGG